MRLFLPILLVMVSTAWGQETHVDFVRVNGERRSGVDWCVLESQISGQVAAPLDRVLTIIHDYPSYPAMFPRIQAARATSVDGATLLSQTVQVSVLGITTTNRFTLRIVEEITENPASVRMTWTQEWADGTIDSLEGGWTLEDVGSAARPLTKVTYRTKSAVPVQVFGQDVVIRMFLGGETKDVVDAVFKKALTR